LSGAVSAKPLNSAPWLAAPTSPVFPSAENTSDQLAKVKAAAAAAAAPRSAPDIVIQSLQRHPAVLWAAAAAVAVVVAGAFAWLLSRSSPAPEAPKQPLARQPLPQPEPDVRAAGPAEAVPEDVQIKTAGDVHRIHTPRYEASLNADGRL